MMMAIKHNAGKQIQVQNLMAQHRHEKEQDLQRQALDYLKSQLRLKRIPHEAKRLTEHSMLKMETKLPGQ